MKIAIGALGIVLAAFWAQAFAADTLETRLTAIEDHQAITDLVVGAYPRALDEQRLNDYGALFTADGEMIVGDIVVKTPAAIVKFLSTPGVFDRPKPGAVSKPPTPLAKAREVPHIISNPYYKIEGNTATGGAYWTEVKLVNGQTQVIGTGHYEDVLRKVNGQWKFAKRKIMRDVPPDEPIRGTGQAKAK
ncbi:MAG: nuclear transport factor 2 family protein [Acidobacteriota bacterium]|jgi:hypothetical protein